MKRLTTYLLATITAVAVLVGTAASAFAAKTQPVTIAMKDPGCHWFLVGGKYKAKLVVHGKTTLRNLDEAAVLFKSAGYFKRVAVGKTLTIAKPGTYKITMVKQAKDDNTLVLVVK